MGQFLKLLILVCAFSYTSVSFAEKPTLRVVAEEWAGSTNADLTGKYWDILRATFADDYDLKLELVSWERAVNLVANQRADIIVGVFKDQHPDIIVPSHHLDMDSSFYLLYDSKKRDLNQLSDIKNLRIAGRKGYILKHHLPEGVDFYPLSTTNNVNKLIFNKRIDGALLYGKELNLADPTKLLDHIELLPKQKMYFGFAKSDQGEYLASYVDEKMPQLIANGSLKGFFPNTLAYQFANYAPRTNKPKINWFMIPKMYQASQTLNTIKLDHNISSYVNKNLPDYQFDLQIGSSRIIDKAMIVHEKEGSNCAVNVFKTSKRSEHALFSKPINTYIKPRLVTFRDHHTAFEKYQESNSAINIQTLLKDNPELRIGVINKSFAHNTLREELSAEQFKKLFVFQNRSYSKTLALMKAKRIDAVLIWPTVLPEISIEGDVKDLTSFAITPELGNNRFTYLMCNDTPLSQKFLSDINQQLTSPSYQKLFFNPVLNSLDNETAKEYKKALELNF